jgi:hypothetical protein
MQRTLPLGTGRWAMGDPDTDLPSSLNDPQRVQAPRAEDLWRVDCGFAALGVPLRPQDRWKWSVVSGLPGCSL